MYDEEKTFEVAARQRSTCPRRKYEGTQGVSFRWGVRTGPRRVQRECHVSLVSVKVPRIPLGK